MWGKRPMGGGFGISVKRNGMESRKGTMGPRTAICSTPPLGFFRAPWYLQGSALSWIPEASPQMTFLGVLGFAREDCSHQGRARQPMGCSSSVSRVEPGVLLLARFGVIEGDAPFLLARALLSSCLRRGLSWVSTVTPG